MTFVRSGLPNYDRNEVSDETGLACPKEEHMTKQEFAEEVDINTILRRFNVTGQLPENVRMPTYADFTDVYDFHSAANAIAQANEAFAEMPADVRKRFENDPAQFVAFCSDETNRDDARKLGLLVPEPVQLEAAPPIQTAPPTPSTGENQGNT